MATKQKKLTAKQRLALELLTDGKGHTYKEIAETVKIDPKQLWRWRNDPDFSHFQEELDHINDEKWLAIVDAARASAKRLVDNDNQKMVEFVLKNAGYNPTNKIEADVTTDIVINIEGE
jgi:transposase-like protein